MRFMDTTAFFGLLLFLSLLLHLFGICESRWEINLAFPAVASAIYASFTHQGNQRNEKVEYIQKHGKELAGIIHKIEALKPRILTFKNISVKRDMFTENFLIKCFSPFRVHNPTEECRRMVADGIKYGRYILDFIYDDFQICKTRNYNDYCYEIINIVVCSDFFREMGISIRRSNISNSYFIERPIVFGIQFIIAFYIHFLHGPEIHAAVKKAALFEKSNIPKVVSLIEFLATNLLLNALDDSIAKAEPIITETPKLYFGFMHNDSAEEFEICENPYWIQSYVESSMIKKKARRYQ